MSTTLSRKDAAPSLVDADWYKGIEGEDWKEMFDSCKVMSRAVGVKKPQEAQKAKALWTMKAAKDRKEEFYDPAREEDISKRNKSGWSFRKNISRTQKPHWTKHQSALKVSADVGSRLCGSKAAKA